MMFKLYQKNLLKLQQKLNLKVCLLKLNVLLLILINQKLWLFSNVSITAIESGKLASCHTINSILNDSVEINMGVLDGCYIQSSKFTSNKVTMLYCEASNKNAFTGSATVIQGFIYGCDFSSVEAFPGVMKGAQCCKFKSTLLSRGAIMADLFGNKNAASNGMNTGV